jgi:hypothetical protein
MRGQSLWQADPAGAELAANARGFTGAPVPSCVRPSHANVTPTFSLSVKLCAGSRIRIQVAEPANDSLRLVIKTAFCNQSSASQSGGEYPIEQQSKTDAD